ncbi:hypothetical protein [Arthrobacter woluwensis]|uniref:Uncharacterized protein n=1 Tax=Arthrobacter woluwensis TaxID=156980 RepID=A0A1H4TBE9_9MICC|nr:hypothetical protein [Arthrobacter woluwensis]SEB29014.1 hypothetical protein SAMN04489745_0037 [Arthrobacter woluwensis]SEC53464.1 hypothetical protein SAMN04489745_3114 [Arthrobacter woluwensis]
MTVLDLDRIEALCNAADTGVKWWGPNTLMNGRPRLTEADAMFIAGTGPDVVKELVRQLREARAGLAEANKFGWALLDKLGGTVHFTREELDCINTNRYLITTYEDGNRGGRTITTSSPLQER